MNNSTITQRPEWHFTLVALGKKQWKTAAAAAAAAVLRQRLSAARRYERFLTEGFRYGEH